MGPAGLPVPGGPKRCALASRRAAFKARDGRASSQAISASESLNELVVFRVVITRYLSLMQTHWLVVVVVVVVVAAAGQS